MLNNDGLKNIVSQNLFEEKKFWVNTLHGFNDRITLSNATVSKTNYAIASHKFKLPIDISQRLVHIANNNHHRLFVVLSSCVFILMKKITGTTDITVGTVIEKQLEHADFINVELPLRAQVSEGLSGKELVLSLMEKYSKALNNQNFPIETIYKELDLVSEPYYSPLFDVMVFMDSIHDISYMQSKASVFFVFNYEGEAIEVNINYDEYQYSRLFIERLENYFNRIVLSLTEDFNIDVNGIDIISQEVKNQLLVDFNKTQKRFSTNTNLIQLVFDQGEKTPDGLALVYKNERITYRQLLVWVKRLTSSLEQELDESSTFIGIMFDESIEMIVSILAVLNSGLAYMPIDPDFPKSRKRFLVQDSDLKIIISDKDGAEFPDLGVKTLLFSCLDNKDERQDKERRNNIKPADPAYLIYTSGSTGTPKGVIIEHENILNQMQGLVEVFGFDKGLNHILMANLTFDPSLQQIFLPLITGGTLHIVNKQISRSPENLLDYLHQNEINIFNTVPSVMKMLTDLCSAAKKDDLKSLDFECIILAGEVFSVDLLKAIQEYIQVKKIVNIYGPTEATINTTLYECKGTEMTKIPIGRPLINYKVYVLDMNTKLSPFGTSGNLFIGGTGVSRGYINNPELTHERFIINPYSSSERIYNTGDWVRWLDDGNMDFIVRKDEQFKINGVRIEPKEIEKIMLEVDGIDQVLITVRRNEKNENKICSYYISSKMVNEQDIIDYISTQLPLFMIPSRFVKIDKIPLTLNGKVDFGALPDPFDVKSRTIIPPSNETEEILLHCWKEVMKSDQISVDDDFFIIGGDSIVSIRLINLINTNFKINLSLVDFLSNRTIQKLAVAVLQNSQDITDEKEKYLKELENFKNEILNTLT